MILLLFRSYTGPILGAHITIDTFLYTPTILGGTPSITTPATLILGSELYPPRVIPEGLTNTRRIELLVEVGLGNSGKSLRRTLLNQVDIVGCWFHSELVGDHGSRDFSAHGNHGTYEGPTAVRGLSVTDLPEGGLAMRFDGGQQVRVPHDGLSGGPSLSLASGGFDVYVYLRTTTNDGNARGIITKLDASTNSGWDVWLGNGTVICRLFVNNVQVFAIASDFIADGLWHRVGFCYEPELSRVTSFRDGVQKTQTSGPTTEPIPTPVDVIIGGWNHLNDGSFRFVGDLFAVMIGREGNVNLPVLAEMCTVWTDLTPSVLSGVEVELGDANQIPFGSTAGTGRASFKLTNANPMGRYSPGHANALVGFGLSRPVRIRMDDGLTIRPLFRGFISDLVPTTGAKGERAVSVDCVDWMEVLSVTNIGAVEILRDKTSSYCLSRLVDQMVWPPAAVSIDVGDEVFPFAFDQIDGNTRALQEIAEITRCEGGATFIRRDGTFVFQARQQRQLPTTPVATLSNQFQEMDARQGLDHIINIQRATVYPRESGNSTTTVLTGTVSSGSTKRRQEIAPGKIAIVEGSYADPEERAASAGGMDIQTLVANTDYTMTEQEDGSGSDLTAYLVFLDGNPPQSGSTYSMRVQNTHPFATGYFHWQIRGRILRRFDAVTTFIDDIDSINEHLPREGPAMSLRYMSNVSSGQARCQFMVSMFKNPATRAHNIASLINLFDPALTPYLNMEIGSSVVIDEIMSAISGLYWVQGLRYSFEEYNVLNMSVNLVPAAPIQTVFVVGDATFGIVGTAVLGY